MANYYVRSAAAGSADGSTWANAYTTLAAALTARAAGDTFWVADDHAETQASVMTLTSPGTIANRCQILCVNTHTVEPPTALATTATVTTTGNNAITFAGSAKCYGVIFSGGTSGAASHINILTTPTVNWWRFESCSIRDLSSSVGAITLGASVSGGSTGPCLVDFENTTVQFANVASTILPQQVWFRWKNTPSALLGTISTTLFTPGIPSAGGLVELNGVDLSAAGSGKTLFSVATLTACANLVQNCKLGASVALVSGTKGSRRRIAEFINCDSASTNYKYHLEVYEGTIDEDSSVTRSTGATDGTTPISEKMVSSANVTVDSPLRSRPIVFWNESTSSITLTIPILTNNVTLKDNEAAIEVEYLSDASFPLSTVTSTLITNPFTTAANLTTDSTSTWNNAPGTPVKQQISLTFTPARKGPIRVRVLLAKTSTTLWFDPKALAGNREYMVEGGYVNEPAAGGVKRARLQVDQV